MDNFIVSARKYRPQTFAEVVGQEHIVTTLKNAIKNNQIAHSFLFTGPRGVGKTTCARILARTINCQNLTVDFEACNECESCKSFNHNGSFNIHELDAASNNSVEDIRNLIDQVRFAPQTGKYKIYIIDEVHMLSQAAFNAFLKTLEEPPSYAIFILATTEKHKILPTILSRCQIFDFKRIRINDVSHHLEMICKNENVQYEVEALQQIALKCDGAMRDALSMLDKLVSFSNNKLSYAEVIEHLNILDYDYFFKVTDAILAEDSVKVLLIFDDILQKGFEGDDFLIGLSEHFRNLLICKEPSSLKLLETSEKVQAQFKEQAAYTPTTIILTALSIASQTDIQFKASKNKRLLVELALIKMCYINSMLKQPAVSTPIESKKNSDQNGSSNIITDPEKKSNPVMMSVVNEPKIESPVVAKKIQENNTAKDQPVFQGKTSSLGTLGDLEKQTREKIAASKHNGAVLAEDISTIKIDEVQFHSALNEYMDKVLLAEGKKSLLSLYKSMKPTFDRGCVQLSVNNSLQKDQLDNNKVNLLAFLKQKLNHSLMIEVRIEEKEKENEEAPAYTSKQKFDKMAKKNPLLNDLKNKLELDFDF